MGRTSKIFADIFCYELFPLFCYGELTYEIFPSILDTFYTSMCLYMVLGTTPVLVFWISEVCSNEWNCMFIVEVDFLWLVMCYIPDYRLLSVCLMHPCIHVLYFPLCQDAFGIREVAIVLCMCVCVLVYVWEPVLDYSACEVGGYKKQSCYCPCREGVRWEEWCSFIPSLLPNWMAVSVK